MINAFHAFREDIRMKKPIYHRIISSILWNLLLITTGAFLFGLGLKAIAIPHKFVTGGISGLSLLLYYVSGSLSPGVWYLVVNIPVFLVGWIFISKRFFFYSLYGMFAVSLSIEWISIAVPIHEPILAVLAGGILMGIGSGIVLHSLGSSGGLDIIGIILDQKFSLRMGTFFLSFNMLLFCFGFTFLETDLVLYSIFMSYVMSQTLNYVLSVSNHRKMVIIISDFNDRIAKDIQTRLKRGVTFLSGTGAYSESPKKIILTVVHNYQLKRLEEAALTVDPNAFIIKENTFNVLGRGFSRRKVY
jgi:uncharacterized membrane-anchored protein YitT (DUF2179 family)